MRKKVLLVDDSPTVLQLERAFLGEASYELLSAGNGGDAIAAEQIVTPGFAIGPVRYPSQPLLYADLPVFEAWGWKSRPAILLGMDLLGRLDRLVIDYSRPRVWVAPA